MSILRCGDCEMWLDTDECPETYREDLEKWLCDRCYEEKTEEEK